MSIRKASHKDPAEAKQLKHETSEAKQLKQNISSSLKPDHLENKYNDICAIDEDDDDLEINHSRRNTNQAQQSQYQQQSQQLPSAFPIHSRMSSKPDGVIDSSQWYSISNQHTNKNSKHSTRTGSFKIDSSKFQSSSPTSQHNSNKITSHTTISTQANMASSHRSLNNFNNTARSNQQQQQFLSLTLSRQAQRSRINTNSGEDEILLAGVICKVAKPSTTSSVYHHGSLSQQSARTAGTKHQRNHSQSQQKYQKNRSLLSSSASSQVIITKPTAKNPSVLTEDQLIRQFPFTLNSPKSATQSSSQRPYIGSPSNNSNNSNIGGVFGNYNQMQQSTNQTMSNTTPTGNSSTNKANQLASMLLSQKQVNDIEQLRKKGKSDFYTQMASFDMVSPIDHVKSIKDIQQLISSTPQQSIQQLSSFPMKKQNQGAYKVNEYLSKRRDVEGITEWMVKTMAEIMSNPSSTLISVFSQQQLVFNACMSELIRQIGLECRERAELVQNIWNQQSEVTEKVLEFYSKENNRIEWDTLHNIKDLHMRYTSELKNSQLTYESNNQAYYQNVKQLDACLLHYRLERKLNKKLTRLCGHLKDEKKQLNALFCAVSKEYIQLLIAQGKLKADQEQFLIESYNQAAEGLLSRKFDFKALRSSIKLKDKSEKQKQEIAGNQNKDPMSSESSGEEEDQPGDMIHRRRLKFEEKGVNTDNPSPKKNQQTETEFNKLFMVSKGIQVQQTGKKVGETQTEDKHTYNIFTQTETKLYATNFCQTDVTVSKNSEDFEKLKTVYLKKLKADPIFKSSIENDSSINIDGQSQDIDPNVFQAIQSESKRNIEAYELRRNLEGIESKKNIELPKGSQTSSRNIEILQSMNSNDGKKQSGKDDDSQKFERAQNKKKSSLVSKKSRMSLFSQPTGLKSSSLADQQQQPYLTASQLQQDDKDQVFLDSSFTIEDIDVNSFIFESQKKLFKAILKISENSKFIKLDVKNSKCTQSGYQDAIKELSRQLQILSLQIRMQLDESKATERNLRIEGIDLAMELEEISEMQGRRNKGNQLYLRQQRQIQSIVEDIVLSSENESSPSMSPKRMISTFLEGSARQKNTPNSNSNSYSKLPLNNNNNTNANTFMIKDPFSNHQNVQNAIDMDKERAQQRQGNRKSSRLGSQKFLRGDSMFTQAAQQATTTFNEQPSSIRPKQLSQQLKQQQLTTQLLAAATTPIAGGTGSQTAIGMNNNISNNYLYSSGKKQDVQLRKQLKKLKQAIKNTQNVGIITAIGMDSTTLGKSNQGYGQFNRSVQSLQSEQIYEMVDAIAAIANKKNNNKNTVNVNSESISTKNNVIQIRKMLSIVLSELSRNITQTGGGLSSPLLLLLNNYYLKSTGSQSSAIQKIKALLDRAITVPKSYQEITLFTYLIGLSSEHDYASAEYLNIYLSMLMQLSVNSQQQQQQQSQSQQLSFQALNINYTQIQTTTIKIHKYLPNILQGYLPDKTVYDIVFEILKPYIEENDSEGTNRNTNKGNSSSSGRNSLTNRLFNEQSSQIPQPTLVTLQLQDIIMFVLRKFKEQSSSIITMHVPLFECVTYCDDEEISEQQFKMILKHVGHTDIEKHDYHLFCFKKAAKKTAMIKQNFIGFLNKSFAIDDLRFRDLLESNDPGELNTRDFDSLSGLEIEWPRQRDRMKMCLYEAKIYSSLHRRLIGIVNAYLQNIEKNTFTAKKHFKTQALLAYKLLRSEIKDALMDKVISEYFIPGNIESMIAAWKDIDAKKRFKQIAKKERILKKIGQNNQLKDAEKEKGMEIIGRNKLNGRADSDRSQRSSDSEDNDGDYYSDPDEQEYEEDRKKNLNYNNIEKAQLQQHDRTSITSLAQKILANQK